MMSKLCTKCKGTGVHLRGVVLGWGMSTPDMPCRDCLGTGKVCVPTKTIKEK